MADTTDTTAAGNAGGEGAGTAAAGSENNAAANNGDSGSDDGGSSGDDGDGDDSDKGTQAPQEPKTRHNAFHAGRRIGQKAAQKSKSDDDGDDGNGSGDDGNAGNNDVDAQVDAKLKPFLEQQQAQIDESSIKDVLGTHPEFEAYADTVRNYAKHPSRANVPMESIFLEVIGIDKLMEMGYEKGIKAKEKQDSSASSGNDNRAAAAGKSVADMTDEEFEAYQTKVRNGEKV